MKLFKKAIVVLIIVVALLVLGVLSYGLYLKPKYEGVISLQNIQSETTVYFDNYGIPHIYATTQKEAMVALGYVHAQDRLWQMELMRRIAPGRLSEVFGNSMLKTDTFFAGLGIDEVSDKAVQEIDASSPAYQLTIAYLDGINQYIDQGVTPVEFQLLGLKKQHFTVKDVYNILGYMSFSFAMAHKTDPLMTDIKNQLGEEYLLDFGLNGEWNTVKIKNYTKTTEAYAAISKSVASIMDLSPVSPFIGSNSWVIGGNKTESGKVIFANDPHIGFSQPATWYEAHITTPDYEMYGYYLAGTPFPLLGHNRNYAYGLTMFENDDIDFFKEEVNSANKNQYKVGDHYFDFKTKQKNIKVKDSADVVLTVQESIHGPIMNGLVNGIEGEAPIAMDWVFLKHNNPLIEAVYQLSHSNNIDTFYKGVSLIVAPGLNVMYGDSQNNIAWMASGKLYKMPKGVNSNLILDGSNGIDDQKQFLDFSQNPSSINPPWHYLYSANNQPEPIDDYLYPGYYLPKDRAQRIVQLLESKPKWNAYEVEKMMNDNTSSSAVVNVATIIDAVQGKVNEPELIAILKSWKGTNGLEEIAPTIYNKFLYCYLKNTFLDELGQQKFDVFLSTHIYKQIIEFHLKNETSVWWDNVATKDVKETRDQILVHSFHEAVQSLKEQLGKEYKEWQWKRVHTLEHHHPFGKIAALRKFFDVGPHPVPGANEVINNMSFTYTASGIYEVKAGPSTRRIIDFSDIENSISILPTGQSGNVFSKHYKDQAEMYNQGRFRKMLFNKQEIIMLSTKMTFKPVKK